MYKILCDGNLIYDSMIEDFKISKGVITKELNKSGSFVFTIYSNHPYYNDIDKMKSIITVLKNDSIIFRGRVINEAIGFHKDKTFTCEGELGFLLDSIQKPFTILGTPGEILGQLINVHNSQVDESKQFIVGGVNLDPPITYPEAPSDYKYIVHDADYGTSFDVIQKKLIEYLKGYIIITGNSNGKRVISWTSNSPYVSNQRIEFGSNLLDFTKTNKAEDIATVLIPLGYVNKEDTDTSYGHNRLTIESVNDGKDYIEHTEAVNMYGRIVKAEMWDDIEDASLLKSTGEAFLLDKIKQSITIELSAIDLSLMDKNIDSFTLGDYIRIVSAPHGIDDNYLLEKQTIDLLKPDNDKITLGYSVSSFTDSVVAKHNDNATILKTIENIESNYMLNTTMAETEEELRTLIDQTSTSITTEVLADYVVNEELVSAVSTLQTQLNDQFEFKFTELETVVNEHDIENRRALREISSYIRFEDGNIILGETGNELTVKIENDRIAFLEGDIEVAYFSNQKLYITDAEILASLRIGNFAYIPRANGNTSWKKIGG